MPCSRGSAERFAADAPTPMWLPAALASTAEAGETEPTPEKIMPIAQPGNPDTIGTPALVVVRWAGSTQEAVDARSTSAPLLYATNIRMLVGFVEPECDC